ncbi:hypothetical protein ACXHXG_12075 [Rhizobium sp. LEGMi198b]
MAHDIEFLKEVYERMHRARLVQSKVEFSTRMLGKGPSYLTSMSARDRNVPEEVVAHLRETIVGDLNDIEIKATELEEQLRRFRLEQAQCRDVLDWIADADRLDEPKPNRKMESRLLAGLLDMIRGGFRSAFIEC